MISQQPVITIATVFRRHDKRENAFSIALSIERLTFRFNWFILNKLLSKPESMIIYYTNDINKYVS